MKQYTIHGYQKKIVKIFFHEWLFPPLQVKSCFICLINSLLKYKNICDTDTKVSLQ